MLGRLLLNQYIRVYRFDRWLRQHFTETGHLLLILLIATGIFGIDTKVTTTYQLFVFLLVIFICSLILSLFNRGKFSIVRQLPRYATVGEPMTYSIRLANKSGNKQYDNLALIEQLAEPLPDYPTLTAYYKCSHKLWINRAISFRQWRRYLIYQRGGFINEQPISSISTQVVEIKLNFTPLRRGKLNFTGSYIAKPDLLGLFRRLFYIGDKQSLLVLPRRYPVAPLALSGKRKYQAGGVSLANSVGDSAEFMSLRDYRQGDALNNIHWKSYARHGKLIVKEYQDEYFVRRALLLDTFAVELDNEQFEAAVSVAASIAMSERQNDALLDLMFVEQKAYRFTTGRGVDHMPHLQEILASVQQSQHDDFVQLQNAVMSHAGQCSSFVCVLLHWDELRQNLVKQLNAMDIPVAVFLIHEGQLNIAEMPNKPVNFYPLDFHHLERDLAQI